MAHASFFGVAFLAGAFFFAAAAFFGAAPGVLVLVTRPDLVLPRTTAGLSSTAGASFFTLGLAAAFFAGAAFLVAVFFAAGAFLVAVFFGAAFLAAAGFFSVFSFCGL